MKIFLVRNLSDGTYLHIRHGHIATWVSEASATIYNTFSAAFDAGDFAFDYVDDVTTRCEIVKLDTEAGIDVLRELFDIHPLGDLIYMIRECEGKGWDGPRVKRWAAAIERAKALIKEE